MIDDKFRVSEIFKSIEGEGIRAGFPAVFVRLHGCNLNCSYCDSTYACIGSDYSIMTLKQIVDAVRAYKIYRVTLTGGEPLIYSNCVNLIAALINYGIEVNVETNGSIDLNCLSSLMKDPKLIITMDWKSYSSGEALKMKTSNLLMLTSNHVLKFVVGTYEDLEQMNKILNTFPLHCKIFVSPVFGKIEPKSIVEYLLNNNLYYVRMQLQIHKFIWDPNMRGV